MKMTSLLCIILLAVSCSAAEGKNAATNQSADATSKTVMPLVSDSVSILLAASYSAEEYDPAIENKTWVGLFVADKGSVICYPTKLSIEPVFDPMFDEKGEVTGKKVSCQGFENDPMLMIAGIKNLTGQRIKAYEGLKRQLLPGESMELGNYTISATGHMEEEGNVNTLKDYKLVITGQKNGKQVAQTFLEQSFFDDGMISFIWAGDIDGDGQPDLYMNISHKYSFSNPALFLSSKARENELLNLVAEYRLFGC